MPTVEEDVLARLKIGPFPLKDCQALRIGPTTLKSAVWSLRKQGHVITATRDPDDTRRRNLYTLQP